VDPDRHLFACRHRAIVDFIENGAKTQQPDVGQLGEHYIERVIAAERNTPGEVIKPVANVLIDEKCQIPPSTTPVPPGNSLRGAGNADGVADSHRSGCEPAAGKISSNSNIGRWQARRSSSTHPDS